MPANRRRTLRLAFASLTAGTLITVLLSGPSDVAETWLGLTSGTTIVVGTPTSAIINGDEDVVAVERRPFSDRWRTGPLKTFWKLYIRKGISQVDMPDRLPLDIPSWVQSWQMENSPDPASPEGRITITAGWPFRAFRAFEWESLFSVGSSKSFQVFHKGGWHIGDARFASNSRGTLVIPYVPIWPGLLADIAIWSIASGLTYVGFHRARSAHRRRRNRCPHCNYSRTGLAHAAPCPECGRLIPLG